MQTGSLLLVAHDFGPAAQQALLWAGALAKSVNGKVLAVHVLPRVSLPAAPIPMMAAPDPNDDVRGSREKLKEAVQSAGFEAETEVLLADHPAQELVSFAEKRGASLIVLGTHGRGPLLNALLGSMAYYVIRYSKIPVVTVQAKA